MARVTPTEWRGSSPSIFRPRTAHEFAAAMWANAFQVRGAFRAKGALEGADTSFILRFQFSVALLAGRSHFQCHCALLPLLWVATQTTLLFRCARAFLPPMHTGTSIIMHAPRLAIFETAANLELWPKILPHYRYIRYLERAPERNLVVMAAVRSGLPIAWTSEQTIDREKVEVRFHHLKAFTKGMRVLWTFNETPAGVLVEIVHDLQFRIPPLAPLADRIIGDFFIQHIASRTLRCMKTHLESRG